MLIKDLKFAKIIALLSFVLLLAINGFGQNRTEDWFVADRMVDCRGSVPQRCLLVREVSSPDWQYFYSSIAGFNFRENFTQKIRVRIRPRPTVPADSSAIEYRQLKVLSRSRTDGNTFAEAQLQRQNQTPLVMSGRKWQITEIRGTAVEAGLAAIEFDNEKKRFGAKICNTMGGDFEQTGANLKFLRVIGTMMARPEPLNSIERRFQETIVKVTRGEQNGETVTLFAGRTPIMKLEPAFGRPGHSLGGVKWDLTEINGLPLDSMRTGAFLQFDPEKTTYAGFSGCNRIFGKFEQNGEFVKFGNGGMTRMACLSPEAQTLEKNMTAALTKVNRFQVRADSLTLFAGGAPVLKFTAQSGVEGVRWNLSELNGNRISLVDEPPFLHLDKQNGAISGSTGCNRFFGKYELNGQMLSLAGLGMTKRACLNIDRQRIETGLMQAFGKVTRFEIRNGNLHLYNGNIVLMKFTSRD